MEWRVIPLETMSAADAMAREEALVGTVAAGGAPTIRFWGWDPSAVTLGRFQDVGREVDVDLCQKLGVDIVRRMSGGGAMYHGKGCEFAYGLTAPASLFPHDLVRTYSVVLGMVVHGLEVLGMPSCTVEDNSILVGGLKLSGNSQRRSQGVVQVHGTVLYDVDPDLMFSVLRAREATPEGRATPSRYRPVTAVSHHSGALFSEAYRVVRNAMLHGRVHRQGAWTEEEMATAMELVGSKYTVDDWNLVR